MATLNLPDSNLSAVWRLIKSRIAADLTLAAAVRTLIFLDGDDRDFAADLTQRPAPALRFTPSLSGQSWFTPAEFRAWLVVNVDGWLASLDAEDLFNLHAAIVSALFPRDDFAFVNSLCAAGAVTGLVEFSAPLALNPATAGSNNGLRPLGQLRVEVTLPAF